MFTLTLSASPHLSHRSLRRIAAGSALSLLGCTAAWAMPAHQAPPAPPTVSASASTGALSDGESHPAALAAAGLLSIALLQRRLMRRQRHHHD
ncbi:hypothetical protein SAMN05421778_101226 [Sphaerotilus natans]|nr:hypothetical protein [Sphaerotilus natans]SIQ04615.1 hypothetical protein SAMN05421778_101226 [Sphaerotilus natans]